MKKVSRRMFLTETAMALAVAKTTPPAFAAAPEKKIWSALFHLGTNMWSDIPVDSWGPYKEKEELALVTQSDSLRFDESVWRVLTGSMAEAGMNQLVIDIGEGIQYQSHPELAAKGAWSIDRFRAELARLRKMGIEPIPKLNFSTAHDVWLKQYERQVSSPVYYRVCEDVIREVCDIFDTPRFFHLGYDEETAGHQKKYGYAVIRKGDLWWHDFLFFVKTVEDKGIRPWIWSDYYWNHPDLFLRKMPKSVLQSNWYYGQSFDPKKINCVQAYIDLDRAGFDQIPAGSNWSCDTNFKGTVDFCEANLSPQHIKGYLMAPWFFTLPKFQEKNLQAIAQVKAAKAGR